MYLIITFTRPNSFQPANQFLAQCFPDRLSGMPWKCSTSYLHFILLLLSLNQCYWSTLCLQILNQWKAFKRACDATGSSNCQLKSCNSFAMQVNSWCLNKYSFLYSRNTFYKSTFLCLKSGEELSFAYMWPWTTKPVIWIYTSSKSWINKLSINVWFIKIGHIWKSGIWGCKKKKMLRK